ncbi:MAG: hypothetical protein PHT07_14640 [Paludibacter sp.]|nr:hypothetical protein [Paludibacter sp.]
MKNIATLIAIICSVTVFGQTTTKVILPTFNDKYSKFVKQLEAGNTTINYREFREKFIESEQLEQ